MLPTHEVINGSGSGSGVSVAAGNMFSSVIPPLPPLLPLSAALPSIWSQITILHVTACH